MTICAILTYLRQHSVRGRTVTTAFFYDSVLLPKAPWWRLRRSAAAPERMRQAAPLVFQQAKALLIEMGASRRLGELIKGMGSKRTLLVTDSGVRDAGLLEESMESLLVAGVHVTVFDKTVPDPPESLVLECATFAREEGVDSVVGFGGGSSMDVAKLVSLLASPTSSQPLDEMFGVGNARGERLPLLQVPTTAGTGSEVTPISIITTGTVVASNPNQTLN